MFYHFEGADFTKVEEKLCNDVAHHRIAIGDCCLTFAVKVNCHCHLIQNLKSGLIVENLILTQKISWTKLQPGSEADSEQVS